MTKEEMIELLKHHDTVIARLTGLGESKLCSTKELYDMLETKKPKTLEELGWELVANDEYVERYAKKCALPFLHIDIYKKSKVFAVYSKYNNDIHSYFSLSYEELIAITEKMKELGMTNE